MPDVTPVETRTTFIVLGNVTDEKGFRWVCILTSDHQVGWFNRTLFNDRVGCFKKVA